VRGFSDEILQKFMEYDWPGNIRQLENTVIRGLVSANTEMVSLANIPDFRRHTSVSGGPAFSPAKVEEDLNIQDARKNMLYKALAKEGGCVAKAAVTLGISRATMYRLINKHRIDLAEFRPHKDGA